MKALVTGGAGFLGSALVRALLAQGDEVVATVRPGRIRTVAAPAGVRWIELDLRRPADSLTSALAGADVVYHLAAAMTGSWREMHDVTVRGTEYLVEAIVRTGWAGRVVHVSSFSVYDLNGVEPGGTVDEDVALEPHPALRDDYAWTKLLQEQAFAALPAHVELVTVRPGTIYGPLRRHQHRVGRAVGGGLLVVLGGRNRLPLTYVENAASLLAMCGRHPAAAGRVYNAVDPDPPRQWRYALAWARAEQRMVLAVPLAVLWAAGRAYERAERRSAGTSAPPALLRRYVGEPTLKPLSFAPSRAIAELGWHPPVTGTEAFRRTFGR